MNAFAQAAADLHRDPNRSVELTYKPKDAPMIRGVHGILMTETDAFAGMGSRGVGSIATREQLSIAQTALPCRPREGDEIQLVDRLQLDRDVLTVATCKPSGEGASWLLTFTRSKLPR